MNKKAREKAQSVDGWIDDAKSLVDSRDQHSLVLLASVVPEAASVKPNRRTLLLNYLSPELQDRVHQKTPSLFHCIKVT